MSLVKKFMTVGGATLFTDDTTSGSGNFNAGTYDLTPSAATGGTFTASIGARKEIVLPS